jgi:putative ABC transport system permease protein
VSNVASLLLMRALRRRREIAIRIALGISRRRLSGQLIVESVILALLGGAVAVLIAWWVGGVLRTILLANINWSATVIDRRLLGFTLLAALLGGVLAGLAPASVALRRNLMAALKTGSTESGRAKSGGRVALLVTQTALCVVMLAAAGVFLQSLRKAARLDLGFEPDRLITFQLFRVDYNAGHAAVDRVRALPSVATVSTASLDIQGGGTFVGIRVLNGDSIPRSMIPTGGFVDTAYATANGLRLVAGRFFTSADANGGERVLVINQAMANAFWPQRSPVGDCIDVAGMGPTCHRIVGVVSSARWDPTAPPMKTYYMPAAQAPAPACCRMVSVRMRATATAGDVAEIRRLVSNLPGSLTAYPPTPRLVTERLAPQLRPWRVAGVAFLLCGALALFASAAGIYGLVGYDVTQRTHEFGVRITIGATSRDILQLVLTSGLRVVGIGVLVGAASAVAAGRVISSLLFETAPSDPMVLIATALTLTLVALLASLVPGWRATRVNPVVALRAE